MPLPVSTLPTIGAQDPPGHLLRWGGGMEESWRV